MKNKKQIRENISSKKDKKHTVSKNIDSLTGIISTSEPLTMKDIREERLSKKYSKI